MIGSVNKIVRVASFTAVVALGLSLSLATIARPQDAPKDIVDTAVAAGSFKTLATALQAAGLVDTLKGKLDLLAVQLILTPLILQRVEHKRRTS